MHTHRRNLSIYNWEAYMNLSKNTGFHHMADLLILLLSDSKPQGLAKAQEPLWNVYHS